MRLGPLDDGRGFFVEDDGPGIDPEERESVFEWGHSGSEEGTGVGLAFVLEIAEAHGWEVTVGEGTDGGARFEFRTTSRGETDDGPAESSGGSASTGVRMD